MAALLSPCLLDMVVRPRNPKIVVRAYSLPLLLVSSRYQVVLGNANVFKAALCTLQLTRLREDKIDVSRFKPA
jgi:hypothetical protein